MTKIILSFGSFRSLPTGRQARYHAQAAFQRMMSGMVNGDLKIFQILQMDHLPLTLP